MSEQTCQCGKPTAGAWLCDDCEKTLAYAIANIGAYYADLATIAAKATRYGSQAPGKGSIGKAQPLPADMRFLATRPTWTDDGPDDSESSGTQLRWDAWNTIVAWCRTVMDDQPEVVGPACRDCLHVSCSTIRRRRWPRNTVPSMTAYLHRQLRWIVREQWSPVMLDELLDLEHRLRRFVDRRRDRLYLGACTECDGGVYAYEGDEQGHCDDCEKSFSVAASRQGLENELDSQLCTAAEIARLATYLGLRADRERIRKRINQWHKRGRLRHQGHDEEGSPRFLYGAVRTMLYVDFSDTRDAG